MLRYFGLKVKRRLCSLSGMEPTKEVREWYSGLGKKGGKGRAKKLSARRRRQIAKLGNAASQKARKQRAKRA